MSTPRVKLAVGGAAFLLLTGGVVWWQFSTVTGDGPAPLWNELQWLYLAPLGLCIAAESLACALRIWVISRTLERGVRLATCLKAEWAQVAVSTLTPTQSGGGPGQIYIMHRAGTSVGTAVTVMLLSCLGTMIALAGVGLYALAAGGIEDASRVLRAALWGSTGIAGVMVLLAVPPGRFDVVTRALPQAVSRVLETYRHDTWRFVRSGKAAFAVVCLLSLAFVLSRVVAAYLVVRLLGIEASTFRHILEVQIVVLLVEFLAPTPGGAGVVEGTSLALMTAIVPPGHAPYYNLVWRFTTLYAPALAGFVCLAAALARDARRMACAPDPSTS